MWLGADASRLQTHLGIERGRLHAHLGCVAQPEVGRGSVHAHLRPTWGWAWTRPAQLGCGRGRGRVPQPEVGRAPRGSGAAIATQAFCQDPSARWRLGVPLALEPPKH